MTAEQKREVEAAIGNLRHAARMVRGLGKHQTAQGYADAAEGLRRAFLAPRRVFARFTVPTDALQNVEPPIVSATLDR